VTVPNDDVGLHSFKCVTESVTVTVLKYCRAILSGWKKLFKTYIALSSIPLSARRGLPPDHGAGSLNLPVRLPIHPTASHDLPLDDGQWIASQVREWLMAFTAPV